MAPIRVFTTDPGKKVMDEEALSKLLEREDIKDLKIVVISIAGRFREGKSFILNFMLRYLRHVSQGKSGDWLENDEKLEGFEWQHSMDRITQGVLIWDEVFKLKKSDGEEVAVLLMDTQGVFDMQSTVREATAIFSFSVLTSSVQIYNLMQNLKGDDLSHLQLFTEYGLLATRDSSSVGKPFQDITFLIRDWQYPKQHAFGWQGGEDLLTKILNSSGMEGEMRSMRDNIPKSFESVRCFLMPYPGMTVATDSDFDGTISDIHPKFVENLRIFVESALAPENLKTKRINGRELTLLEFASYVKSYAEVMSSDEMPTPKNIFEATVEATNNAVLEKSIGAYAKGMRDMLPNPEVFVSWEEFEKTHRNSETAALAYFNRSSKMGGKRAVQLLEHRLLQEVRIQKRDFHRENQTANFLNEQKESQKREAELRREFQKELESSGVRNEALERKIAEAERRSKELQAELDKFKQEKEEQEKKKKAAEESKKKPGRCTVL